ncbi:hypothetical protein M885DRAFT_551135 [Pelagophyceae sp. CCMP2097]|nr:hypothetical protein M885DRAFT_551135 [Pelagophyceae sp. CCMP2097]
MRWLAGLFVTASALHAARGPTVASYGAEVGIAGGAPPLRRPPVVGRPASPGRRQRAPTEASSLQGSLPSTSSGFGDADSRAEHAPDLAWLGSRPATLSWPAARPVSTVEKAAATLRDEAALAEKQGRAGDAAALFNRAMALSRDATAASFTRLAKLHRAQGDVSSQVAALRRGIEAVPHDAELWRALATAAARAGDVAAARSYYAKALQLAPECFAAWDAWARLELQQDRPQAAAVLAWRGLRRAGDSVDDDAPAAWAPPAGDAAAARKPFGGRSASVPRLWHAYGLASARGGGVDAQGRPRALPAAAAAAEAERAFRRGLARDPGHAHLRHALGVQLFAGGRAAEARDELRAAAARGHAEAPLALGRLEELEGQRGAAREAYRAACAHGAAGVAPWRARARFEERCGDAEAARAVYREAAVRFRRDVELYVQWARMEAKGGQPRYAREVLAQALRNCPKSARAHQAAGDFEATQAPAAVAAPDKVAALHLARRTYHRGARQSNGGRELAALVFSWAHAEWALARVLGRPAGAEAAPPGRQRVYTWRGPEMRPGLRPEPPSGLRAKGVQQARKLFAWAARLAADDVSTLGWALLGRAKLEHAVALAAEDSGAAAPCRAAARHFAALALRAALAAGDRATAAGAWRLVGALEHGDTDLSQRKRRAFQRLAAAAEAGATVYADPRAHPFKRAWPERPPPMEVCFGCVDEAPREAL